MQLIDFSAYLLKVLKIIFIYKSTTYKKLEDRVHINIFGTRIQNIVVGAILYGCPE